MASSSHLDGLVKWLARDEWNDLYQQVIYEHYGQLCESADLGLLDIMDILGDHAVAAIYGCALEDLLTQARDDDGLNVVDDYLKRRGWKESATAKRYMTAIRDSSMSLYEVGDIAPGESFLARDLLRGGEPVRVYEHKASLSLKPWDKIAARIVILQGKHNLTGGILPFTQEMLAMFLPELLDEMKQAKALFLSALQEVEPDANLQKAKAEFDQMYLHEIAPSITHSWLDLMLSRSFGVAMPEIVNSDGDALMSCEIRFPVTGKPAALCERLNGMADLEAANETFWNWVEPPTSGGKSAKRKAKTISIEGNSPRTLKTILDNGANVLGTLELIESTLFLLTNSEARAELGTARLIKAAGDLLGEPESLIEELDLTGPAISGAPSNPDIDLSPEEQETIIHQYLDEHYRKTLDDKIPMLGNKSPRQATKTAAGRRKVVEWLKTLENNLAANAQAGTPMGSYDASWIWEELGVSNLRK